LIAHSIWTAACKKVIAGRSSGLLSRFDGMAVWMAWSPAHPPGGESIVTGSDQGHERVGFGALRLLADEIGIVIQNPFFDPVTECPVDDPVLCQASPGSGAGQGLPDRPATTEQLI
jgi:hypothetical protein